MKAANKRSINYYLLSTEPKRVYVRVCVCVCVFLCMCVCVCVCLCLYELYSTDIMRMQKLDVQRFFI